MTNVIIENFQHKAYQRGSGYSVKFDLSDRIKTHLFSWIVELCRENHLDENEESYYGFDGTVSGYKKIKKSGECSLTK